MLIKIIRCTITREKKQLFSDAQAGWESIKDVNGFVTQFGGWSRHQPDEAVILACWKDETSYRLFMQDHHDAIYQETGQSGTFESITVWLTNSLQIEQAKRFINKIEQSSSFAIQEIGDENKNPMIVNPEELVLFDLKTKQPLSVISLHPSNQEVNLQDSCSNWIDMEPNWKVMTT